MINISFKQLCYFFQIQLIHYNHVIAEGKRIKTFFKFKNLNKITMISSYQ